MPKLIGFVVDDDDGGIIGILEEFIPNEYTLSRIKVGIVTAVMEQRKKWAEQIRKTFDLFHKIGVVWGDGKTDNILINSETDDTWLFDLRGSFTDGGVHAVWKETCERDELAVGEDYRFLSSLAELLSCHGLYGSHHSDK